MVNAMSTLNTDVRALTAALKFLYFPILRILDMADVDDLFAVFDNETEAPASVSSIPVTLPSEKPNKEKTAADILKRHRDELQGETHEEEAKKLKMAIVDEIRYVGLGMAH